MARKYLASVVRDNYIEKEYMAYTEDKRYFVYFVSKEGRIHYGIIDDYHEDAVVTHGVTIIFELFEHVVPTLTREIWLEEISPITKKQIYSQGTFSRPFGISNGEAKKLIRDVVKLGTIPISDRAMRVIEMVKKMHNKFEE